jgi:hypothetical protein
MSPVVSLTTVGFHLKPSRYSQEVRNMAGMNILGWRTISRWFLLLLAIILAAQAGRLLHLEIKDRTNAQAVQNRRPIPYTVMLRETIHSPDGASRVSREITEAVRSDGSTVMRSVTVGGSTRTLYFSTGLKVNTSERDQTKTSMKVENQDPVSLKRDPASNCLNSFDGKPVTTPGETFLGNETIAGYRTAKIAHDSITEWRALDYGCALVKDRWEFSANEVTEKELVALVAGEPDKALFDVPKHYREVSPSERVLGPNKQRRTCNDQTLKLLQMLDDDYKRRGGKPQ